MTKKLYMEPTCEVVELNMAAPLLAGSGITGTIDDGEEIEGPVGAPGFDPMQDVLKDMGLGGFPF